MSIAFYKDSKIFKLDTKNTSYIFAISDLDMIEHLYYGEKLLDYDLRHLSDRQIHTHAPYAQETGRQFALSTVLLEYPSYNVGDYRVPAIIIENGDGTKGSRLVYRSHSIYKGKDKIGGMPSSRASASAETLEILLEDIEKQVEIVLNFSIYPNEDVISRWAKIVNRGKNAIRLEKAASACLDFYDAEFDLIELTGWFGAERGYVQRVPLKKGLQGNGSLLGCSSHHANPFFAICEKNADENKGEVYGFNLIYSSNFSYEVDVDRLGTTRIVYGINPTGFSWELKNNECFQTPEAIMTFSNRGLGTMSRNFHNHIRENIIEPAFAKANRPIVINSWEAMYFDVTEEKILALADEAIKIGVDTIVIDDGWFRNGLEEGLGDWIVDKSKFPNGLKKLSKIIKEKGLKFGIWIEPEMVSIESGFAKENPEKILKTHTNPVVGRQQYALDLTKDENVHFIFERIVKAFDGAEIDYIKWDYNRYLCEVGAQGVSSGESFHRQMLGVYKLLELFKLQYPNAFFETVAGGGGRFDLGMLYYSPQIWTSDNTNPYDRLYIQYGTSFAYPNSSMSCHFTNTGDLRGRTISDEFRYLASAFGSYGYELDLTKMPKEKIEKMNSFTREYHKIERLILEGDLYRLSTPEKGRYCAYMNVSKDKKKAMLSFFMFNPAPNVNNLLLKLNGLDENQFYKNSHTDEILSGKALMNAGLRLGELYHLESLSVIFEAVESGIKP